MDELDNLFIEWRKKQSRKWLSMKVNLRKKENLYTQVL